MQNLVTIYSTFENYTSGYRCTILLRVGVILVAQKMLIFIVFFPFPVFIRVSEQISLLLFAHLA